MRRDRRRGREAAIDDALAQIDRILERVAPLLAEAERHQRRFDELLARCEAKAGITPAQAAGARLN